MYFQLVCYQCAAEHRDLLLVHEEKSSYSFPCYREPKLHSMVPLQGTHKCLLLISCLVGSIFHSLLTDIQYYNSFREARKFPSVVKTHGMWGIFSIYSVFLKSVRVCDMNTFIDTLHLPKWNQAGSMSQWPTFQSSTFHTRCSQNRVFVPARVYKWLRKSPDGQKLKLPVTVSSLLMLTLTSVDI